MKFMQPVKQTVKLFDYDKLRKSGLRYFSPAFYNLNKQDKIDIVKAISDKKFSEKALKYIQLSLWEKLKRFLFGSETVPSPKNTQDLDVNIKDELEESLILKDEIDIMEKIESRLGQSTDFKEIYDTIQSFYKLQSFQSAKDKVAIKSKIYDIIKANTGICNMLKTNTVNPNTVNPNTVNSNPFTAFSSQNINSYINNMDNLEGFLENILVVKDMFKLDYCSDIIPDIETMQLEHHNITRYEKELSELKIKLKVLTMIKAEESLKDINISQSDKAKYNSDIESCKDTMKDPNAQSIKRLYENQIKLLPQQPQPQPQQQQPQQPQLIQYLDGEIFKINSSITDTDKQKYDAKLKIETVDNDKRKLINEVTDVIDAFKSGIEGGLDYKYALKNIPNALPLQYTDNDAVYLMPSINDYKSVSIDINTQTHRISAQNIKKVEHSR